jgi:hypothetical protein
MIARRVTLVPSNDAWQTLSDDDKKRINREEGDRIVDCEIEDEIELIKRIDSAGSSGYRLLPSYPYDDDAIRMFAAAGRLGANNGHICIEEIAPFTVIRFREFRPRARKSDHTEDCHLALIDPIKDHQPTIEQTSLLLNVPTIVVTDAELEIVDTSIEKKIEEPVFKLSNPDAWSITNGGRRRRRTR